MPGGGKLHVRKSDVVRVLAGKDKDHKGRVLSAQPDTNRVIVEGVNMVKKHTRPRGRQPGGIIQKPAPIHASNVMVICPACENPSRMSHTRSAEGRRQRVCKRCGANIDSR